MKLTKKIALIALPTAAILILACIFFTGKRDFDLLEAEKTLATFEKGLGSPDYAHKTYYCWNQVTYLGQSGDLTVSSEDGQSIDYLYFTYHYKPLTLDEYLAERESAVGNYSSAIWEMINYSPTPAEIDQAYKYADTVRNSLTKKYGEPDKCIDPYSLNPDEYAEYIHYLELTWNFDSGESISAELDPDDVFTIFDRYGSPVKIRWNK